MTLTNLFAILALGGGVLCLFGTVQFVRQRSHHASIRGSLVLAVLGLIIGLTCLAVRLSLVLVGPTEVAVVFQSVGGNVANNALWSAPLKPGAHLVIPGINSTIFYSTETRTYTMSRTQNEGAQSGDDSVPVRTSDGQQVYVDISVLYAVDPTAVNTLYLKYQQRYEIDFVRPIVRTAVREIVSGYVAEDMYGPKHLEIQQQLDDDLQVRFAESGLFLDGVFIRNITFSDEFVKAIEAKQVAEQAAQQAKQDAERVRIVAQGMADATVLKAQGESDAAVAIAKGEAQATVLLSAADANMLLLINEQIQKNPLLIQWRYIESLAGDIQLILMPSQQALPLAGSATTAP